MVAKIFSEGKMESREVQKKVGISRMQLIHWTELGIIIPFQDAKGRGARRIYDQQNVFEAIICRELNGRSIDTGLIKEVLSYLREPQEIVGGSKVNIWDYLKLLLPPTSENIYPAPDPTRHFILVECAKKEEIPNINFLSRKNIGVFLEKFQSAIVINLRSIIEEGKQ